MITNSMLKELLDLGEGWEPLEIHYDASQRIVSVLVSEQEDLWKAIPCPHCKAYQVRLQHRMALRTWRHLDGFKQKCLIQCALPKGRCTQCGHSFRIEAFWQGKSKHFTLDFELYALNLLKEMPVKSAGKLLNETDQRLWRMLFAHVKGARTEFSKIAINILHQQWRQPGRPWH